MPSPSPTGRGSSLASAVPEEAHRVMTEIRRIAAEELEYAGTLEPTQELISDLRLDSMGMIVLAVGLENRFRIKLREEDAVSLKTVEDVVELVLFRMKEEDRL